MVRHWLFFAIKRIQWFPLLSSGHDRTAMCPRCRTHFLFRTAFLFQAAFFFQAMGHQVGTLRILPLQADGAPDADQKRRESSRGGTKRFFALAYSTGAAF
jgi:hypothetical protein